MSQWISRFPIPKIYLSFLLLWLYYAIFSASFLALLGFVFLLLCLFFQFPWKTVVKVLFVCGLFGSWFIFQKWQQEEASQHLVDSINTVRILHDTIKVNGDSLSFRGKVDDRLFQVYYKFQSEAEKERFKELSELHEIVVKGKLAIPQGANNFALTILILFLIMPNFFLTAGGVLSCVYAFILTMTGEEVAGIKGLVRESSIISLGILPILSFYFSEFQPWSILLTFVFSFLFDMILLPLLSMLFCLSGIYPITQFNFLFEWLENIIRYVSQLSTRPFVFGQPSLWVLVCLLVSLALIYDYRKNLKKAPLLILFIVSLFLVTKHPLENEITVLDMEQGRSIFLRDMTGKTILLDVGEKLAVEKKEAWQEKVTSSIAKRSLIPYLKSRGVAKIDQLVLTDSEPKQLDHLLETSKAFNLGEILVTEETLSKREFMDKLKESNLKVRPIKTGEQLFIFGSSLEVIENKNRDSKASIAMYGKLLNQTFLVTGNIEEKFLNKSYSKIQADVVLTHQQATKKKTDVEVFEIFQPKITVVSVDKKKKFKEKNGENNQEFGNSIYKTDQKGAIRFKGWGAWQIETVR